MSYNQQATAQSFTLPQMNMQTILRPIAIVIILLATVLTSNLVSAQATDEACIVTTELASSARVRVGPGENRTAVTYLETDTDYTVLGRYESEDGEIWYRLDKEQAAPNRAINEAWVNASDLQSNGNCDDLDASIAPPVIPIISQPTSNTSVSEAGDVEIVPEDGRIILSEGLWDVIYAQITNASCVDINNVEFTTLEWFGFEPDFSAELIVTEIGFTHGGVDFTYIGDNTYYGSFSDGFLTGTVYLTATAPNIMVGRYIDSMNGCSATTNVTLTLQ